MPVAGWYPDPAGANTQRYFDGTKWTDQLAPLNTPVPQRPRGAPAKSPLQFWILAIGSAITCFVAFILMQLAFGASTGDGPVLWFEILGFALFIVFLVSAVGTIIGIIGGIVRLVQ
jgi:hypothetical protein